MPLTGVQIEPRISELLLRKNQQWNVGAQSEANVMSPKLRRLLPAQRMSSPLHRLIAASVTNCTP